MYNDDLYWLMLDNPGSTTLQLIEISGAECTSTERSRISRKARMLEKYGLAEIKKIANPSPLGKGTINAYFAIPIKGKEKRL